MTKKIYGLAASKGIYKGRAKIVKSIADFHKVKSGDVLVVHSSSPAWTVPMLNSGALISELGGVICHTAIVAREMGIPCVVGVENVFEKIKENDIVKVNGETGEIYVY